MLLENNAGLVARLKERRDAGQHSAELLRFLEGQGLSQPEMMSHFREAFDLDFDDVSCIGGWFSDNTGELSDENINALLDKSIDMGGDPG